MLPSLIHRLSRWPLAFGLTGAFLMAQDSLPIPEPAALLERVIEATKALESARAAYTYMEDNTERTLDGKGRTKETTLKTYEVTKVSRGNVRRLVAENGLPLSEEKAKAEDAAVLARLKTLLDPETPEEIKKQQKDKFAEFTFSDMLAVLEISKIERTMVDGRALLAMEIHPKKHAKISGLGQRFASKLQGRIVVDEASSQLVLAEGHMLESCWVGGGFLGSMAPPSSFKIEHAQVGEGVWMPVSATVAIHGRFMVMPIHMEVTIRCRDFKRFIVDDAVGEQIGGLMKDSAALN